MFWEQFWPQLIATIIGIAIGIPVALGINRYQERKTEKERKKKILSMLRNELMWNVSEINIRVKDEDKLKTESGIIASMLKDHMWKAFSDGGELQWIKNLVILGYLSESYYFIGGIKYLADKYYDSVQFSSKDASPRLSRDVYDTLWEAMSVGTNPMYESIDLINREIGKIE
jgi:hypothetical protein